MRDVDEVLALDVTWSACFHRSPTHRLSPSKIDKLRGLFNLVNCSYPALVYRCTFSITALILSTS
jgi:hypothetical protein